MKHLFTLQVFVSWLLGLVGCFAVNAESIDQSLLSAVSLTSTSHKASIIDMPTTNNTNTNSAVILQYHHVSDQTPPITSVTPHQFKQHMAYLHQHQFNIVSLPSLIASIRQGQVIKDKTVVITFDDGYISVFTEARPILAGYQWPYTVFINSQFVDAGYSKHMSWDQLKIIASEGATIANHTREHDYLVRKPPQLTEEQWQQQIAADILAVEARITAEIGHDYKLLAYPYGEFTHHTQATLKAHGFVGLGQHSGAVGPYSDLTRIPRFPASGIYANLKSLSVKLLSLNMPVIEWPGHSSVITSNPPQLTLRIKTDDLVKNQLQCFSGNTLTSLDWPQGDLLVAQALTALAKGRSRYNCTAPSKVHRGRYYWFSQPWVNGDE